MSKIKKNILTKNLLYVLTALFICFHTTFSSYAAYVSAGAVSDLQSEQNDLSSVSVLSESSSNVSVPDSLYAKYAVLLDGDTGRVLYGKNEETAAPMASTTKIMTCILALEYAPPEMKCVTSPYAVSMPDVQLNAVSGEIFSLNDLLYSLMLKSHNDTAVIIAENVALNYLYNISSEDYPFMVPFSRRIFVRALVSIPAIPGISCFSRKCWIVSTLLKLLGTRDNSRTIKPSTHGFLDS